MAAQPASAWGDEEEDALLLAALEQHEKHMRGAEPERAGADARAGAVEAAAGGAPPPGCRTSGGGGEGSSSLRHLFQQQQQGGGSAAGAPPPAAAAGPPQPQPQPPKRGRGAHQLFQTLLVYDLEATCDEEKKINPQARGRGGGGAGGGRGCSTHVARRPTPHQQRAHSQLTLRSHTARRK